jgi:hypothetical protein
MAGVDVESFPAVDKTASRSTIARNDPDLAKLPKTLADIPRDEELRMLRKFDFLLLPPLAFLLVAVVGVLFYGI